MRSSFLAARILLMNHRTAEEHSHEQVRRDVGGKASADTAS